MTVDEMFTRMASLSSERGTCPRRKVGCVLTDDKNQVLSTGRNGPPRGSPHCIDTPCPGANCPSGTGLDLCEAVHAEANALLQCKDIETIHTAYVTDAPCVHCTKMLLNTSCKRIVFVRDYPHSESEKWWRRAGRQWEKYEPQE
jgi:dCMP deaminase